MIPRSLSGRQRRLTHYTPLRYPGGKGKLAAYIKAVINTNKLFDSEYVEPYCGGAAVGLELLFHEYVSRIHINDISKHIHAFWYAVLNHPEELCKLIRDTPLTVGSWDKQKRVFSSQANGEVAKLGFATFFLNRTNRSGILNAGIIGGRDQSGPWKIDARFNKEELIFRIQSIAKLRNRIELTCMDALEFLKSGEKLWPAKALIYLDPPYYKKGRELYYDYYQHEDHEKIYQFLTTVIPNRRWIVSYDNVEPVRELYRTRQRLVYRVGYSARVAGQEGLEVMFFSDTLQKSPLAGPLKLSERFS